MSTTPPPAATSAVSKLPKLTVGEKIAFGFGDTASNFVWMTMLTFLASYYTDIFGLTPVGMGIVLAIGRITDGFFDFAMGAIADRTKTRWGKFRPYLVWWCLPLAIIFVLTFTVPPASWDKPLFNLPAFGILGYQIIPASSVATAKLLYAIATYNLLMLFYSAINIPYGAISGVMTDEPRDRNSLSAYRMALANVGGLIVFALTKPLTQYFGHGNKQIGNQYTVIVFSVLSVILFLICFWGTKERIEPPPAQKNHIFKDLGTLLGNRHWVIMFIGAVINMTFVAVRQSDSLYYFQYSLGLTGDAANVHLPFGLPNWDMSSALLVVGSLAFIAGTMLTQPTVNLIGKKPAFIVSMALGGLAFLPFYWIPPGHVGFVIGVTVVAQVIGGINASLYWSMLGDIADFTEWKYKIRNTGIVFSATTLAQKVGIGVGGMVLGSYLHNHGYVANAVQSEESKHAINAMTSFAPAGACLVIALIFSFYGLNDKFCTMMREELHKRREEREAVGTA